MDSYYQKQEIMRRKEMERGSLTYLLIGLGFIAVFVPVAIITVGSLRAYKKIRGVMNK